MKYEKPTITKLSDLNPSIGKCDCADGSSNVFQCSAGYLAGGHCRQGCDATHMELEQ